ncbi:MAG: hypothetical protein EHM24_01135 [Acidobacteria bacterium]|nr:MAG: hypothetical protein EHM24_01135 [Acidobacteriota bacterium]
MNATVRRLVPFLIAGCAILGVSNAVSAQESKSAALVKELSQLMDQAKLDAIAARDPAANDGFVAALYFPGTQLLVVGARYQVPVLLNERIAKKEFREIYTDLNSACVAGSKYLIMDIGADGLKAKRDDKGFDTFDGPKSLVLDGDWKKQKMASEEEYTKAFNEADERYSKLLAALIAQVKKGS